LDSDLAEKTAITTIHELGCSCWLCRRKRKRLRDEAEADRRSDLEAALPPVKEEARALFDPTSPSQARIALKVAGVNRKRRPSPA